jgi:hypothetical protein
MIRHDGLTENCTVLQQSILLLAVSAALATGCRAFTGGRQGDCSEAVKQVALVYDIGSRGGFSADPACSNLNFRSGDSVEVALHVRNLQDRSVLAMIGPQPMLLCSRPVPVPKGSFSESLMTRGCAGRRRYESFPRERYLRLWSAMPVPYAGSKRFASPWGEYSESVRFELPKENNACAALVFVDASITYIAMGATTSVVAKTMATIRLNYGGGVDVAFWQ